ncbi:MAG: N-acetylneuraminate synthase [Candidatus Omnitrophota bacterium]|nr:N-acetylneuraminate synthase [Candidatus Omnitrophota bacterium]MDZ4242871.1 N-acetylneuraminate synthase [Candidatus Omnitrophota bacterium]
MFKSSVKIADRRIASDQPVFIIAEAGVNHNGDLGLAKKLVDAAKKAGADAVKFQTFKAENLNTRKAPKSTYHVETTGKAGSWFDLLKSQELDRTQHEAIIRHCRKAGILFLSTPYDEESADLLDDLDVPAFKVASTDANNIPFLKYLASKKRPVLLSTAMCTMEEVGASVRAVAKAGCRELVLFHCTANYPTAPENVNLRAMKDLEKFGVPVGYSDHTMATVTAAVAVALGARAYEKHLTLDKNLPGPDHRASATPEEFGEIVRTIRGAEKVLGDGRKRPLACESENRKKLRKSVVALSDLPAGSFLTRATIGVKRPGTGLEPKHFEALLGKKIKKPLKQDDLITWQNLSSK